MKNHFLLSAVILTLSACGGGGSGDAPTVPPSGADSYFALVSATASGSSESAEPQAIESIAATAPEDAEPAALDTAG